MKLDLERFAEDSVQKKSIRLSFIGTCIIWFILLLFFAISPFTNKKNKYKDIQIILEPVEQIEKAKNEIDRISETQKQPLASSKNENSSKIEKSIQTPVKKDASVQKNSSKASAASPSATAAPKSSSSEPVEKKSAPTKAKITYKKSVEELLEEQDGSKDKALWDDSIFGDDNSSTSSNNINENKSLSSTNSSISGTSALSGNAASATKNTGKAIAKSDSDDLNSNVDSTIKNTLSKIASTTYSMSATGNVSSVSSINVAKANDGKVAVELTDGSARILLEPSKPVIMISEENAALIDSSRSVVINFRILAGGNVPFSEIKITPSSLLPLQIQSEIKQQISKWRFKPVAYDGQARFEYSIIKR